MKIPILKNREVKVFAFLLPGLITFTSICLSVDSDAQVGCLTTGWKNATAFITDNSIGDFDFSTSSNAQSSDDQKSNASNTLIQSVGATYYLRASDFGFTVPLNATICGIIVEIEIRANGSPTAGIIKDNEIRLIEKGDIIGDNKAGSDSWESSDTYRIYGSGNDDLWGLALTPEVINLSDFGVAISSNILGNSGEILSAEIDHIRMKVDYKLILPLSLDFFKATKKGDYARLEWKTAEEESQASIILQRSVNNRDWEQVVRYDLVTPGPGKLYNYQDAMQEKGNYSYRLRLNSANQSTAYSNIIKLNNDGGSLLVVYPNPAYNFVTVENITDPTKMVLYNLVNQEQKFSTEKISTNVYRLNISKLPAGSYIIKTGKEMIRFIKAW